MERAAPGSPIWPCSRWGFPCLRDCSWSGGLLPHLFTLAPLAITHRQGGLFSVALSVGTLHIVASRVYPEARAYRVTRHRALWSSDFPPRLAPEAILRPFQNQRQVTCRNRLRQAANQKKRNVWRKANLTTIDPTAFSQIQRQIFQRSSVGRGKRRIDGQAVDASLARPSIMVSAVPGERFREQSQHLGARNRPDQALAFLLLMTGTFRCSLANKTGNVSSRRWLGVRQAGADASHHRR